MGRTPCVVLPFAAWNVLFLLSLFAFGNAQQCAKAPAAAFHVSIENQRNASGFRNIGIHFENRAEPGTSRNLANLEADHTVSLCDGAEIHRTELTITAPPVAVRYPGYELFPGLGYYKFNTTPVVWHEAQLACMREGANLLVLNSEAEANVVRQFLQRKNSIEGSTWPGWAYAGFHDRGLEGDYRTVLGGPLNTSGYTNWHPGQPDNKPWGTEPDQDCGSFNTNALLNDLPCLGKLPFICEQRL